MAHAIASTTEGHNKSNDYFQEGPSGMKELIEEIGKLANPNKVIFDMNKDGKFTSKDMPSVQFIDYKKEKNQYSDIEKKILFGLDKYDDTTRKIAFLQMLYEEMKTVQPNKESHQTWEAQQDSDKENDVGAIDIFIPKERDIKHNKAGDNMKYLQDNIIEAPRKMVQITNKQDLISVIRVLGKRWGDLGSLQKDRGENLCFGNLVHKDLQNDLDVILAFKQMGGEKSFSSMEWRKISSHFVEKSFDEKNFDLLKQLFKIDRTQEKHLILIGQINLQYDIRKSNGQKQPFGFITFARLLKYIAEDTFGEGTSRSKELIQRVRESKKITQQQAIQDCEFLINSQEVSLSSESTLESISRINFYLQKLIRDGSEIRVDASGFGIELEKLIKSGKVGAERFPVLIEMSKYNNYNKANDEYIKSLLFFNPELISQMDNPSDLMKDFMDGIKDKSAEEQEKIISRNMAYLDISKPENLSLMLDKIDELQTKLKQIPYSIIFNDIFISKIHTIETQELPRIQKVTATIKQVTDVYEKNRDTYQSNIYKVQKNISTNNDTNKQNPKIKSKITQLVDTHFEGVSQEVKKSIIEKINKRIFLKNDSGIRSEFRDISQEIMKELKDPSSAKKISDFLQEIDKVRIQESKNKLEKKEKSVDKEKISNKKYINKNGIDFDGINYDFHEFIKTQKEKLKKGSRGKQDKPDFSKENIRKFIKDKDITSDEATILQIIESIQDRHNIKASETVNQNKGLWDELLNGNRSIENINAQAYAIAYEGKSVQEAKQIADKLYPPQGTNTTPSNTSNSISGFASLTKGGNPVALSNIIPDGTLKGVDGYTVQNQGYGILQIANGNTRLKVPVDQAMAYISNISLMEQTGLGILVPHMNRINQIIATKTGKQISTLDGKISKVEAKSLLTQFADILDMQNISQNDGVAEMIAKFRNNPHLQGATRISEKLIEKGIVSREGKFLENNFRQIIKGEPSQKTVA